MRARCQSRARRGNLLGPRRRSVLWWIDIYGPTIHRFDPKTGKDDTWQAPEYLGTLCGAREAAGSSSRWRAASISSIRSRDNSTPIVDPGSDIADTRFNDGKTDRQGRFWSGSMFEAPGKEPAKIGALYRLDPDLSVHKMIEGVGCSNGLAWSPDSQDACISPTATPTASGRMISMPRRGDIANRRVFIDLTADGRHRRRRDGRCRGLLLADRPVQGQGSGATTRRAS